MNCKPGDLAILVRSPYPWNIGKMVKVIDSRRCDQGEWRCEALGTLDTNLGWPVKAGAVVWADDAHLRPIRDPGDDVHDPADVLVPEPLREVA